MKQNKKERLMKGLKFMAGALPLAFLGPIIIYSSFNNQDHPFYVPVLVAGILIAISSMFLIFRGINIMVSALFD